jgi:hypothetical protein
LLAPRPRGRFRRSRRKAMARWKKMRGGVVVFAAVPLIYLLFWGDSINAASRRSSRSHPQKPNQAKAKPTSTVRTTPESPGTVRIEIDSFKPFDGASADPVSLCGLTPASGTGSTPWGRWVSLDGTRLSGSSSSEKLPVYAVRVPYGSAFLLMNNDTAKASFKVGVRLSRGVYTIERLTFDPKSPETLLHAERLESVVQGGTGTVSKPGWLPAGTAAIYRFTNRSAQTAAAFDGVMNAVRAFMGSHPSEFRTVIAPLRECEGNVGALSRGIPSGKRDESLRHIHRALLTLAQAQSISQNLRGQGRLNAEDAEALANALNHLESVLTELSAGCLNLVPAVDVTSPDPSKPQLHDVTISLLNAGSQPVSMVKLGATAPSGCAVEPQEQALFSSLAPGETAHATFHVRLEGEAAANSIVGDVAYIAARVPAHLRIKAL